MGRKHNKKNTIIDVNKYNNIKKNGHTKFDASSPYTFFGGIVVYIIAVSFIIVGIPWKGIETKPIPLEDLPMAIPAFIFLYIIVYGILYIFDKRRKTKKNLKRL